MQRKIFILVWIISFLILSPGISWVSRNTFFKAKTSVIEAQKEQTDAPEYIGGFSAPSKKPLTSSQSQNDLSNLPYYFLLLLFSGLIAHYLSLIIEKRLLHIRK